MEAKDVLKSLTIGANKKSVKKYLLEDDGEDLEYVVKANLTGKSEKGIKNSVSKVSYDGNNENNENGIEELKKLLSDEEDFEDIEDIEDTDEIEDIEEVVESEFGNPCDDIIDLDGDPEISEDTDIEISDDLDNDPEISGDMGIDVGIDTLGDIDEDNDILEDSHSKGSLLKDENLKDGFFEAEEKSESPVKLDKMSLEESPVETKENIVVTSSKLNRNKKIDRQGNPFRRGPRRPKKEKEKENEEEQKSVEDIEDKNDFDKSDSLLDFGLKDFDLDLDLDLSGDFDSNQNDKEIKDGSDISLSEDMDEEIKEFSDISLSEDLDEEIKESSDISLSEDLDEKIKESPDIYLSEDLDEQVEEILILEGQKNDNNALYLEDLDEIKEDDLLQSQDSISDDLYFAEVEDKDEEEEIKIAENVSIDTKEGKKSLLKKSKSSHNVDKIEKEDYNKKEQVERPSYQIDDIDSTETKISNFNPNDLGDAVDDNKFGCCAYTRGMSIEEFLRANPKYREAMYVEHFFNKDYIRDALMRGHIMMQKGRYCL